MLAELRITPMGCEDEFARVVADVVRLVADGDMQYEVHGMGTTVEGQIDDILDLVRRCHEEVRRHSDRVLIEVSIDDRAGREGELVRSVERVRELELATPIRRLATSSRRVEL